MNESVPLRAKQARAQKRGLQRAPRPKRRDMEFLAPALEILETPPSPVRMALIIVICLFAATALIWAYVGRIDIIATAQGKIDPLGKVKIVEPLQTGRVAKIRVHNGDHVSAGQVLAELDATELASVAADLSQQLKAANAEILRRRKAIDLAGVLANDRSPDEPAVDWPADMPDEIAARETRVLRHDLSELDAQIDAIDSQIAQKQANANSIAQTIDSRSTLVATLGELASMRQTLVDQGSMSRADWLTALQNLQVQQVALSSDRQAQADVEASIAVLRSQKTAAQRSFVASYTQKLSEAEQRADDLTERLKQAQTRLEQMTLRSPIDGVILASKLTTLGQVVTTGQEVMRVVPENTAVEIEAFLSNQDIGFVKLGQAATVKIAAYPFTQYGTIPAKVVSIGHDAISSTAAQQALADASYSGTNAVSGNAGQGGSSLVFPIVVKLDTDHLTFDGNEMPLSPGMAVTVDINTGSRRILQYVLAPLVEVGSSALHER